MDLIADRELNDGTTLPAVGLGTFMLGAATITAALQGGYRLIDTAAMYRNEADVGQAVRNSGIARDDVIVQSKIPVGPYGRKKTHRVVEIALRRLGLERVDVMLIHWPFVVPRVQVEQWQGLIDCRERGLIRTIGVSNFGESSLRRLIRQTGVTPAVNQIQVNPRKLNAALRAVNEGLGILTEAYSPLGGRRLLLDLPGVTAAARAHGVSPGQVILRWQLQLGTLPLPKSANPQRQRSNLDVASFELTPEEVAAISR